MLKCAPGSPIIYYYHINPQQASTSKMTEKIGLHKLKLQMRKGKEPPIIRNIRPYKQRQEQDRKQEKFKIMSETNNNDQQIEHITILSNMQDVANQVEENVRNSIRDDFFSWPSGNESQPNEELMVLIRRF